MLMRWHSHSRSRNIAIRNAHMFIKEIEHVYSSTIQNGPKLETTKCSCKVLMYTCIVVSPHWVLYSHKSEQTKSMYSKAYEPHAHSIQTKYTRCKCCMLYYFSYRRFQKQTKHIFGDRSQSGSLEAVGIKWLEMGIKSFCTARVLFINQSAWYTGVFSLVSSLGYIYVI